MFGNPLIERYKFSQLRPQQFWVYAALYAGITVLVLFINWTMWKNASAYISICSLFKSMYYQFLAFQFILLLVVGAYNSAAALRDEFMQKSYDFFRLLPLSAAQKAMGILVGRNLAILVFAGINLVLMILFGVVGGVNLSLQAQLILLLVSSAVAFNISGLLSSMFSQKKKGHIGGIGFIIVGLMVFPSFIGLATNSEGIQDKMVAFFTLSLPVLVVISLVLIYLVGWLFKGILRVFTVENEPVFTRAGVLLFMAGYMVIAFGFLYPHFTKHPGFISAYLVVTFFALFFLPFGCLRQYENYLENEGHRQAGSQEPGQFAGVLSHSNIATCGALALLWMVLALGVAVIWNMDLMSVLRTIAVFLSFYLVLALLLENVVVFTPAFSKIAYLGAFVAFLYLFLPLLLAGIMAKSELAFYSFFGYWVTVFDGVGISFKDVPHVVIIVGTLTICMLLSLPVLVRYRSIIKSRAGMP